MRRTRWTRRAKAGGRGGGRGCTGTDGAEGGDAGLRAAAADEYADLTVDEEQPDEEAPAHEKFRLPAGVRVFAYVCCVLAASVLLAIGAWRCADDMLALTRENFAVNVTVPENATIAQISTELKDKGLIQYEWLFKFYCWFSKAERKIDPGTYELRGAYDYHALVNGMVRTSGDRATATVMIPEGYECEDIFALLAENGVCAVEGAGGRGGEPRI